MSNLIDLVGRRFGRLAVLRRTENVSQEVCWLCKCSCGNYCTIRSASLRQGLTRSCGCLQSEIASQSVIDLIGKRFPPVGL